MLEGRKYDVILANINLNILLRDLPVYEKCLTPDGSIFLSGFYQADLPAIKKACKKLGLYFVENFEKNDWVAAKFSR